MFDGFDIFEELDCENCESGNCEECTEFQNYTKNYIVVEDDDDV